MAEPLGHGLIAGLPCPMGGKHRLHLWRTPHLMGIADVGYREGCSCRGCHQTWTTVQASARLVPPTPTWPDPSWPPICRIPA